MLGALYSCNVDEISLENQATFDLIQDKILTTNCATSGCHAIEADASNKEHGLLLAKGFSFANLINKPPKNIAALEDGLGLVFQATLQRVYSIKNSSAFSTTTTTLVKAMAVLCLCAKTSFPKDIKNLLCNR